MYGVDINVIHRNYDVSGFDKGILFFHQIVIAYMVLGLTLTSRSETIIHLLSALIITAMWNHNGNCILSEYMNNSLQYRKEDHHLIVMDYPTRRKFHLSLILPIIAIDTIKLILLKT
jgi:hypothetical protein